MRLQLKSTLLATVKTSGAQWIVPTRLALAVLLLFPIDGSIQHLFAFRVADLSALSFSSAALGKALRAIEILAGLSFVAGLGARLAAYPTVVIFAVRALANSANSFPWLRDAMNGVIVPHGDWGYGAMYFGVALLLGEFLDVGSGRWSIDYWLSRKLKESGEPRSGR